MRGQTDVGLPSGKRRRENEVRREREMLRGCLAVASGEQRSRSRRGICRAAGENCKQAGMPRSCLEMIHAYKVMVSLRCAVQCSGSLKQIFKVGCASGCAFCRRYFSPSCWIQRSQCVCGFLRQFMWPGPLFFLFTARFRMCISV